MTSSVKIHAIVFIVAAGLLFHGCGRKKGCEAAEPGPGAGEGEPAALEIYLFGAPDASAPCRAVQLLEDKLTANPAVMDVFTTGHAKEEIVLQIDPDMSAKYGIDEGAVAAAIRGLDLDVPDDLITLDEEGGAVRIAMTECRTDKVKFNMEDLQKALVKDAQGNMVPLAAFSTVELQAKSKGLQHNGSRALKVEVQLSDPALYKDVKDQIMKILSEQAGAAPVQWEIR
ncbi:MAG: efflux RND transporter permease subunit [Pseudomonadota bacterium]